MQDNKEIMIPPLITIGLLTYNNENTLVRALDGLVNQTYSNYEIIIFDDYSTDNTKNILLEYAKKFSFIQMHCNLHNIGMFENFNFLLKEVNSEYFLWACPDDEYNKLYLEKCFKTLMENKNNLISTSAIKVVYDDCSDIFFYDDLNNKLSFLKYCKNIIKAKDNIGNYTAYNSIIHSLIKTSFLKKMYHESIITSCEEFWTINALNFGSIAYVPELLWTKYESYVPYNIRAPCYYSKISGRFSLFKNTLTYMRFFLFVKEIRLKNKLKFIVMCFYAFYRRILPRLFRSIYSDFVQKIKRYDQFLLNGLLRRVKKKWKK